MNFFEFLLELAGLLHGGAKQAEGRGKRIA